MTPPLIGRRIKFLGDHQKWISKNKIKTEKISTFGFRFSIQPSASAECENAASVIHCLEGSQPSQIYFYLFLFFGTSRSIFLESPWNLNSKLQSNKQKILFYLCGHNIDISSRHTVVVANLALSLLVWPQLWSLKEQNKTVEGLGTI